MSPVLSTAAWFHLFGDRVRSEAGPAGELAPVALVLGASVAQLAAWGDVRLDLAPRRGRFLWAARVPSVRVTFLRRSGRPRPGFDTRLLSLVEQRPRAAHDLFWAVSGKRDDVADAVLALAQQEVVAAGLTDRTAIEALATEFEPRHEMWRGFCRDHPDLLEGLVEDVQHAAVGKSWSGY